MLVHLMGCNHYNRAAKLACLSDGSVTARFLLNAAFIMVCLEFEWGVVLSIGQAIGVGCSV